MTWTWRVRVALARWLLRGSVFYRVTPLVPSRMIEATAAELAVYVGRSGGLKSPHRIRAYTRINRWAHELLDQVRAMEVQ